MGAPELKTTFVNHGEVSDYEFLTSMERVRKPYWEDKYIGEFNENVKLRVDPKTGKPLWDMYWENLVERQNIWYKRVVQGLPKPWTDDPVMGAYHFTNVDRRLDRMTLFYIDNVLGAFKENYEQSESKATAKAFLILNTFIYRLFLRIETWNEIGYIKPETFEEDWERAKANLRARKASGEPMFTDAYYVNDLKSANPNTETNSCKTENSICLIQWIIDNLAELSAFCLDPDNSMEEVIENFTKIPAVGLFNAYEACLDLGTVEEFTGIPFVEWTPDHYPNVGPGCKRGIDYIFENRGGMDYVQIVFFMGEVWRHELARKGLEYKFQEGVSELDLRCLEGWFCESSKYFNWYATENGYEWAKGKRPKKKMKLRTSDVEWLKPRS